MGQFSRRDRYALAAGLIGVAALGFGSASAAIMVPADFSGTLNRDHNGSSLWHRPTNGVDIFVADTVFFPRQETRSYAIFDLTSVPANVSSGNLQMTMPVDGFWSSNNDTNAEGMSIYDIGTNLNTLTGLSTAPWSVTSGIGVPIHNDLGSGALYGTAVVGPANFNTTVSVALTAQAIEDINAAAGTVFGMGFNGTTGQLQNNHFVNPQLVLFTFGEPVQAGGGIDFRLDEGQVSGAGEVNIRSRGVDHHLNAHALGQQTSDRKFSEVRRRFTFTAPTADPVPIVLSGDLDGSLFADQGGAAVEATLRIFDTVTGAMLADDSFSLDIRSSVTDGELTEEILETLRLQLDLMPGRTYEMISRLDLNTTIYNSTGRADALFGNTLSVNLTTSLPEPGTLALLGLAATGCLSRATRSRVH